MPQPLGRQAPPVQVITSGGRAWRAMPVVLSALAAAVVTLWGAPWVALQVWPAFALSPWPLAISVLAALTTAVGVSLRTSAPSHHLVWNGQAWLLNGQNGQVQVMLDVGRWLLLRFAPVPGPDTRAVRPLNAQRRVWVAVPAADAGAAWHGLRAALYSRAALNPPPETGWPPA